MKILVVEDENALREVIVRSLEKERYVVESASSFREASLKINDYDYDCIVLDIMLPGGSGLILLKELRALRKKDSIIIISAKDSIEDKVTGLDLGADDYLTKPFDTEILKTKIKGVLQNRKIMRQYFLSHSLPSVPAAEPSEKKEDTECANLLSAMDKEFLERCTRLITENLANPDFTINQLSRELALSRTIFYEKLKALTGQAPNEFIKLMRMTEAANLLKQGLPVQDVALLVGFTDSKYFSTAFKKHFGVSPSKFL